MRRTFHSGLDEISGALVEMSHQVGEMMDRATAALLDADVTGAERVISQDAAVDDLYRRTEERAYDLLARHQPVAGDLRTIVTSLNGVADLERMGDLAVHVAKITRLRYPRSAVPGELTGTMREMGRVASRIAAKTSQVLAGDDPDARVTLAREIAVDDDAMDALHRRLFVVLLDGSWPHGVEAAIDITLLGRFYERFADHAVSVAERVVYLVTGERPEAPKGRHGAHVEVT
jgi:phosphate transport system protein